jgi:hypothetical protein
MNDAELSELYVEGMRAREKGGRDACPPVDALEQLVLHRADDTARVATLDHAMACSACRRELELLRAIHVAMPVTRSVLPRWVSIAAGLVLVAGVTTWFTVRGGGTREPERGSSEPVRAITEGAVALGTPPRLQWHAVSGARRYRVEVLTVEGTVADTAWVTDTTYVLPAPVAARGTFDWWVRAELETAGGRSVQSRLLRVNRVP